MKRFITSSDVLCKSIDFFRFYWNKQKKNWTLEKEQGKQKHLFQKFYCPRNSSRIPKIPELLSCAEERIN
jgi:hypothetical protein